MLNWQFAILVVALLCSPLFAGLFGRVGGKRVAGKAYEGAMVAMLAAVGGCFPCIAAAVLVLLTSGPEYHGLAQIFYLIWYAVVSAFLFLAVAAVSVSSSYRRDKSGGYLAATTRVSLYTWATFLVLIFSLHWQVVNDPKMYWRCLMPEY